jgi:sarcosine oxidase subunit gamma
MAEQIQEITLEARSPLMDMAARMANVSSDRVKLAEVPFKTQLTLRGNADEKTFVDGVKRALGVALPTKANTVNSKGEIDILWMGPDEWLILAPEGEATRLMSTLKVMLSDQLIALVDVSDNRTMLTLSGSASWDVLNKGAHLDFHPRSWKKGMIAQSTYGRAQVIFWQSGNEPEFRLLVRNSFAEYLATFLMDAMAEFAN